MHSNQNSSAMIGEAARLMYLVLELIIDQRGTSTDTLRTCDPDSHGGDKRMIHNIGVTRNKVQLGTNNGVTIKRVLCKSLRNRSSHAMLKHPT